LLNKPTAIDLFAGVGGFSLGLIQAGYKILAAVEIEKYAAQTYDINLAKRYGIRVLQEDITTLSANRLLREAGIAKGELGILVGGPPCQGFSLASKNRSIDDPRSRLMWEFIRMTRGLKPKFFMVENVAGLFYFKDFFILLMESFEKCGYVVRCLMMDACSYGVPQYRKRIFIQGARRDLKVLPVFPKPTHFAPERLRRQPHSFSRATMAIGCFAEHGFAKEEVKDLWWNEELWIMMNRKKAAEVLDNAVHQMLIEGIQRSIKNRKRRKKR
jgi:DNA (cytosine-5)-methyltransferase 1